MPVRVDRYFEPKLKEISINSLRLFFFFCSCFKPRMLPGKYLLVINRGSCRDSIAIFRNNGQMCRSLPARVGIEVPVITVICESSIVPNLPSYRFGELGVSQVLDNLRYNNMKV